MHRSHPTLSLAAAVAACTLALTACTGGHGSFGGHQAGGSTSGTGSAPTTTAPTTAVGATTAPPTTSVPSTPAVPPVATTVAGVTVSSFPAPVADAFRYLEGRVPVPLEGPSSLPATASDGSQQVYLSATAGAGPGAPQGDTDLAPSAGGYIVGLYYCPAPYPLNDPRIADRCEFAVSTLGGFGAVPQASPQAAVASLEQVASRSAVDPCPAGSPTTDVDGQPVSTCGQQPAGLPESGPARASWHEGEWTFVYTLGQGGTVADVTGTLIRELKTVALPPRPGWFSVEEGNDGEHSSLAWAVGSTDYTVYDYHSAPEAALLASHMERAGS